MPEADSGGFSGIYITVPDVTVRSESGDAEAVVIDGEYRSHGDGSAPYDAIYGAYLKLQRMVLQDGFKLILYPEAKTARLYHVAEDPYEQTDLSDDDSHQPVMRKLWARFQDLQKETGDTLDLNATFGHLN